MPNKKSADAVTPADSVIKDHSDTMMILRRLWDVNDRTVTEDELKEKILVAETEELTAYFIGRIYEWRKGDIGRNHCERDSKGLFIRNDATPKKNGRYLETADYVAKEIGISPTTVKRNDLFAQGIDAIRKVDDEAATAILFHEKVIKKVNIVAIGAADEGVRTEMINALILGKPVYADRSVKRTKKRREDMSRIAECVESLFGGTESTYTVNSLCREIRMNAEPFVEMIRQKVEQNKDLCAKHKTAVMRALIESVIYKIEEIEEVIRNYE